MSDHDDDQQQASDTPDEASQPDGDQPEGDQAGGDQAGADEAGSGTGEPGSGPAAEPGPPSGDDADVTDRDAAEGDEDTKGPCLVDAMW
jgi:hypothetical protein